MSTDYTDPFTRGYRQGRHEQAARARLLEIELNEAEGEIADWRDQLEAANADYQAAIATWEVSFSRVEGERDNADAELAEWQTRALIAEESASAEAAEHENWKAEAEALRTERDEVRKLGHFWKQIAKERADLIDELYDSLEEARGLG